MHFIVSNNLNLLVWSNPPPHCPICCITPHFFQPVRPGVGSVVLLLPAGCVILPSTSALVSCLTWSSAVHEFVCTVHQIERRPHLPNPCTDSSQPLSRSILPFHCQSTSPSSSSMHAKIINASSAAQVQPPLPLKSMSLPFHVMSIPFDQPRKGPSHRKRNRMLQGHHTGPCLGRW
jgi:hypothetical protein